MSSNNKIGFGGGCHWCTEAVFSSLLGVGKVEQGWIASSGDADSYSEAIVVHFNADQISLDTLIDIHLNTHSSTSAHAMRNKYRSAIYSFDDEQHQQACAALSRLQAEFDKPLITRVLPFKAFKSNQEKYLNYYYNNPDRPFCRNYVTGKIATVLKQFSRHANAKAFNVAGQSLDSQ